MLCILSSTVASCGCEFGVGGRVRSSVYSLLEGGSIDILMVWVLGGHLCWDLVVF